MRFGGGGSMARAPIFTPKIGVSVNAHNELINVPKLQRIGVVGLRHDCGGRVMSEQGIRDLLANSCNDTTGWKASNSILWTIAQTNSRTQSEFTEAAMAVAAGVRILSLGNEQFNHWWGAANPEWSFQQYLDWCGRMREIVGPAVTLVGGSFSTETGAGLTLTNLAQSMAKRMPPIDFVDIHEYEQTVATAATRRAALAAILNRPVFGSEWGIVAPFTDQASCDLFIALKNLGLASVYYDGCATDARGLLAQVGGAGEWNVETPVYNLIARTLAGAVS